MTKKLDRLEAIKLRKEKRLSLKEIAKILNVAKSTVSLWVRDDPLTKEEKAIKEHAAKKRKHQKARLAREKQVSKYYKLLNKNDLSNTQKGIIAESAVLFRCALYNIHVFKSPFDGAKIDFIVKGTNSKCKKLQVRWASTAPYGLPHIRIVCSNGRYKARRYKKNELDFIIGYDLYTDDCYIWSWKDLQNIKKTITIKEDAKERWDKIIEALK